MIGGKETTIKLLLGNAPHAAWLLQLWIGEINETKENIATWAIVGNGIFSRNRYWSTTAYGECFELISKRKKLVVAG
jgi:hypothetical protein